MYRKLRDELRIGGNVPPLPDDLQKRLDDVIREICEYAESNLIPESGSLLQDVDERQFVLRDIAISECEVIFRIDGTLQQILKGGKFSKVNWHFMSRPWPHRGGDAGWGGDFIDNESGDVGRMKVLGKYVDFDR